MRKERCIIVDGKELKIRYFTPEEEEIFRSISEEMWESDRVSELNSAKRKAIEEGKKEGQEEGKREKQIEIAKKLVEMKMKIEEISKVTELSKEEIDKIKNNT